MNLKQAILITVLITMGMLVLSWVVSLSKHISFEIALLVVLIATGTGILVTIVILGVCWIYDKLD